MSTINSYIDQPSKGDIVKQTIVNVFRFKDDTFTLNYLIEFESGKRVGLNGEYGDWNKSLASAMVKANIQTGEYDVENFKKMITEYV